MLRDGYRVSSRGGKDRNAAARGLRHVDIIITRPVIGDHIKVRISVLAGAIDDPGTDDRSRRAALGQERGQFDLVRTRTRLSNGESRFG